MSGMPSRAYSRAARGSSRPTPRRSSPRPTGSHGGREQPSPAGLGQTRVRCRRGSVRDRVALPVRSRLRLALRRPPPRVRRGERSAVPAACPSRLEHERVPTTNGAVWRAALYRRDRPARATPISTLGRLNFKRSLVEAPRCSSPPRRPSFASSLSVSRGAAGGAVPEATVSLDTVPESAVPPAASGLSRLTRKPVRESERWAVLGLNQ